MQEVLKLPSSFDGTKITLRQLYTETDDYRPLLKEIKKPGETGPILVKAFTFKQSNFKISRTVQNIMVKLYQIQLDIHVKKIDGKA